MSKNVNADKNSVTWQKRKHCQNPPVQRSTLQPGTGVERAGVQGDHSVRQELTKLHGSVL